MAAPARAARTAPHRHLLSSVAAVVGLVHASLAPSAWREAPYLGSLHVLAAVVAAVLAIFAVRGDPVADGLAVVIGATYGAGYIVSRIGGLPGVRRPHWTWMGAASLTLDVALIALGGGLALRPALRSRGRR